MNKIREGLRLILTTDLSNRVIGRTIHVSHNTILRWRNCIKKAAVDWDAIQPMDDVEIESLIRTTVSVRQTPPVNGLRILLDQHSREVAIQYFRYFSAALRASG